MSQQTKVDVNIVQDFTDAQKSQARSNIGAASESVITSINSILSNYSGRITSLENNKYIPYGAVIPSATPSTTPIATGDIVKVSASVTNQSYMQLVIEPVDTTTHTLASCVVQLNDRVNSSNSSIRILNPYLNDGSASAYSGYIVYAPEALGIGTIDIMVNKMKDNTMSYHKADVLWYCPTGAGVYCLYVILKENA